MAALRNVFACLVHERPECVADLVRNLRSLDPASEILLYNGGKDPALLSEFPFERYGAVVVPEPRPLEWGRLLDFALDCFRFSFERSGFDTLTIVDSDQLAVRRGYSERLAAALEGKSGIGMFGNSPGPQPRRTRIGPAAAAFREAELWRPWLQRFERGEEKFVHWTFWPSTVFTAGAARDVLQLVATDSQLQEILQRSQIWATEEVILPTLVALLGYEVAASPFSYDFVKYKQPYTVKQIDQALARPDVYWAHPIPRRYDDPLRKRVRQKLDHYGAVSEAGGEASAEPGLLVTLPILERMRPIPGWLDDEEADLLIAAASRALSDLPAPHSIVEVGSHCGRATVVLGSVLKTLRPDGRIYAIDPHLGEVGALDQGLQPSENTLERLRANLASAGLTERVEVVQKRSIEVDWQGRPISLLLIDGLHDYVNVASDFCHFEASMRPGGYIAFHDYAEYYPGVRTFVDELLASGRYARVHLARSLMVLRKLPSAAAAAATAAEKAAPPPPVAPAAAPAITSKALPLVSCIMPTSDRRAFVPLAIRQFLSQDYPEAELIVVDDGTDRVADLIPADPRIRYIPLEERHSIGAKRNVACQAARGEVILHWDDDDWMEPRRIRFQVESLLAARADLCGLPRLYFHDPESGQSWEYTCPRRDKLWLAGATFCYRKNLWRASPFPDTSVGEDSRFLWSDRPKKTLPLRDSSFYVARIHASNTGSKPGARRGGWRSLPPGALPGFLKGEPPALRT